VLIIKETDMYQPIKDLLESLGFTVKGEVKNCDIAAKRGDCLWIVEMKLNLNISLLYQAMRRQSITKQVFVAIPRPKQITKDFRLAQKILKKLELGLITVALDSPALFAEIILLPAETTSKLGSKKASAILKEMEGRSEDTPGGSRGIKITTAYRERCIRIACHLAAAQENETQSMSAAELVRLGCPKDASAILRSNHYGWFTRISKGRYVLSEEGINFLAENQHNPAVQLYLKQKRDIIPN